MRDEGGMALLMALIVLSVFSLLGLFLSFNATSEVRISDNFESLVQAKYAALAGVSHARALLRGLDFDDLLKGPDGVYVNDTSYLQQARTFAFRNPVPWTTARLLSVSGPALSLAGIPDDGLLCAGSIPLIPLGGIALTAQNPYGAGTVITGRYFVKASDNNGEATELAGDPADNPFVDGDGIIIIRSMGVAQTIGETVGTELRRNSIVAFEARYRRRFTFDLISPLTIVGNKVTAVFSGNSFSISGGSGPGIGTIDSDTSDGVRPDQVLRLAAAGTGIITGAGLPIPSIRDLTDSVKLDAEKTLLLDPQYLWELVTNTILRFADSVYSGDQSWSAGTAPNLGVFDSNRPIGDQAQDPRITVVNGNLSVGGGVSGAGILVVRGDLLCGPGFAYSGLILVIGTGKMEAIGAEPGILGGVLLANVNDGGVMPSFGIPTISLSGSSRISANSNAIKMAIALLPPSQISFREVPSVLDAP